MKENPRFIQEQIITYIGNKRSLLSYIEEEVKTIQYELKQTKTVNADLFSGSGVVARMLKQYSSQLIVNDLEKYSCLINSCYLSNKEEFDEKLYQKYYEKLQSDLCKPVEGIVSKYYSPQDENQITTNDRVFYTKHNAKVIDTIRLFVDSIDEKMKKFFLAPLLYEASVHVNTAGVFKGFYKDSKTKRGKFGGNDGNALSRIKGEITIEKPILSNFSCPVEISCQDALKAAQKFKKLDIVYLDPPYNQHPYGSNYFMLNIILKNNIETKISKVSGIPDDWQRSNYNNKKLIFQELEQLIKQIDSKYILLSYNSEGFLTYDDINIIMKKYGKVRVREIDYNAYRGSRNLQKRDIHVKEYLFILKKKE